jgi:hypothetical protein
MRNTAEDTTHNVELKTHNSELTPHASELKTRNPRVQRDDPVVNELMIRRILAALRGLE